MGKRNLCHHSSIPLNFENYKTILIDNFFLPLFIEFVAIDMVLYPVPLEDPQLSAGLPSQGILQAVNDN